MLRAGGRGDYDGESGSAKFLYIMKDGAAAEARRLGHSHVRTGHVLLALLNDPDTRAFKVLAKLNVDLGALRDDVRGLLPPPDDGHAEKIGLNIESRTMLNESMGWAAMGPDLKRLADAGSTDPRHVMEALRNRPKPRIDTHVLLLGLMGLEETIGGRALLRLGIAPEQVSDAAGELPPE
jgi:hypothetical protein